ncbi:hypothetical protein KEM52_004126, partial [Ascosphaera acerosa]
GLTYCAIGVLHFLDRLPSSSSSPDLDAPPPLWQDSPRFERLLEWLANRQTTDLAEGEQDDAEEGAGQQEGEADASGQEDGRREARHDDVHETDKTGNEDSPPSPLQIFDLPYIDPPAEQAVAYAGFNGRANKLADTCYCFWVTASLA